MKKWKFILVLLVMITPSTSFADLFMKSTDIQGGSSDPEYADWSDIMSISGNFSEGYCGNFMVEKSLDKASLKYIEKAVNGELILDIDLESAENIPPNGVREITAAIRISQATVLEVETSGDEGTLYERLTLNGLSVTMKFYEYNGNGQQAGTVQTNLTCPAKKQ